MGILLFYVASLILSALALYWIIRLAVRDAILDAREQVPGHDTGHARTQPDPD
ncbi:hypothetical protein [Nocardioides marmoriginsengisoli]|uniref:hypothetical protein n=1 Tax=Nocardioides marmoriginsengisoli TaxID=661483 RepID=UPI00161AE45D|nr:hypothetical protein [Nocardioides marmoriginsengisoli]